MKHTGIIYAPVRMHPDGDEFIHWAVVANSRSWVEHLTNRVRKHTPEWDSKYPLVRIAAFECIEITNKGDQS